MVWVQPGSFRGLCECWPSQRGSDWSRISRQIWCLIPAALSWSVWEERNRRLFDGTQGQYRRVLDATLSKIHDWLSVSSSRDSIPSETWMFDWDRGIFHVM